jgi:hypothetical protein
MSREELIPLISPLLEWVQDMNWPIAREVVDILITFPGELVPHIKQVLLADDDVWKYWCLTYLIKLMEEPHKLLFDKELKRLVESPTSGESQEEVDVIAGEILQDLQIVYRSLV